MTVISEQIEAVRGFLNWRNRAKREGPLEADLVAYEQHLNFEAVDRKLNDARVILENEFDAADPKVLDKLRAALA